MHVWTNASYSELKQGGGCNKSLVSHIPRSRINFACTCFSIESSMSFAIDFSTLHWSQDQLSIDWMIASKWFSMKEFLSAMLWFLPQIQAQFLRSKENLALKAGNTVLLKGDLRNLNFTWKSGLTFRWKTSYWTLYELSNLEKLDTKMEKNVAQNTVQQQTLKKKKEKRN